jgi:hypothetical protein
MIKTAEKGSSDVLSSKGLSAAGGKIFLHSRTGETHQHCLWNIKSKKNVILNT